MADAAGASKGLLGKAWDYVKPLVSGGRSDEDTYNFNHKRRGVALIICNDKFEGHNDRDGANHDVRHFELSFRKLGFRPEDIRIRSNMTVDDILNWFVAVSLEDLSDCDCLMVAISSHGDQHEYVDAARSNVTQREDIIYGVDKVIFTKDLVEIFTDKHCPSLAGKPKIFFLQACRGTKLDVGVNVECMDVVDAPMSMMEPQYTISPTPCFKDFCIVYATPPGHFAFRRPSEGSWFVKGLWDVVSQVDPSRVDFQRLITMVIRKVGFGFQSASSNPALHGKKQSGSVYSMLVKDVYFTPKGEEESMMLG